MNAKRNLTATAIAFAVWGLFSPGINANASVILYSENFEGTGVADGAFASGWTTTDFTFAPSPNGFLLNPAASGASSAWLNPVPVELGAIFATLPQGSLATANTGAKFVEGGIYQLTFTHFRRDDLTGLGVVASIGNSGGALASVSFDAVAATDTYITRTVSYTAPSAVAGQDIYIRLGQSGTLNNNLQAGVDNITLSQQVPEPSTLALFGIAFAAMLAARRRSRWDR